MARPVFLVVLFLFFLAAESRLIVSRSSDLVSDGSDDLRLPDFPCLRRSPVPVESSCEQTYGFLPCTTTVLGNLFLIVVYGYLMFFGATHLSNGSEILLQILGPGIVGGLFLPVLGALPDAILILVSGLSGSKETAQSQVLIGIGVLAGSTVMLLTVLWGSCIVVGKCDLSDTSTAIDGQDSRGCSLSGSGVTTDSTTSKSAGIMVLSVIPFIVVQLPQVFHHTSWASSAVMAALILAIVLLISYCLYQIFEPWIQKRRVAYAKHKHAIAGLLRHMNKSSLGRLVDHNGEPSVSNIEKMFELIDADHDSQVSLSELRALVIGIQFDDIDLDKDEAAEKIMVEFDTSGDSQLNKDEFIKGISKWILEARKVVPSVNYSPNFLDDFHQHTVHSVSTLSDENDEDKEDFENPSKVWLKAVMLLILGTVIAVVFADPLVDAVDNFSSATSIPSFFISFILLPFATNSSEAVSALIFASRKKQRTASLMFSEIYGGVTMNNLLCLAVFLALVSIRGLTWDFSSEVLIILMVVIVMGLFASFRTTFPLWTCSFAYLLYPLSILLVYILDYVLGWS